jgi:hypothetical protein
METDEKSSTKEYSKMLSEKEKAVKIFNEYFKQNKKIIKFLDV